MSKSNRRLTVVDMSRYLARSCGIQLHPMTVRRRLKAVTLHGRIARRKPFVSLKNRQYISPRQILAHCQQHSDDGVASTISRLQPDGKFVEQDEIGTLGSTSRSHWTTCTTLSGIPGQPLHHRPARSSWTTCLAFALQS